MRSYLLLLLLPGGEELRTVPWSVTGDELMMNRPRGVNYTSPPPGVNASPQTWVYSIQPEVKYWLLLSVG